MPQLEDFIRTVLDSVVAKPEAIELRSRPGERKGSMEFGVCLDPADRARLEADDGRLLDALYTTLDAAAWKRKMRASLMVVDSFDAGDEDESDDSLDDSLDDSDDSLDDSDDSLDSIDDDSDADATVV
jgi:predicted RNA-binding protein YlqC (UPF0109 family)